MLHRVNDTSVAELNRVLSLIQQSGQNQSLTAKGISATKIDIPNQTSSMITSPIVIRPIVETGDITAQPIIVSTIVSTDYPTFGYGSQWGESWGL